MTPDTGASTPAELKDNNTANGELYSVTLPGTIFSSGSHTYFFDVLASTDALADTARLPQRGTLAGPTLDLMAGHLDLLVSGRRVEPTTATWKLFSTGYPAGFVTFANAADTADGNGSRDRKSVV